MPNEDRRKAERGFTMPEALVVVCISLVMVALTGKSMMSAVENYRVTSAARQLTATIQVAHLKAPAQSARYRVRVDTSTRQWFLERFNGSSWNPEAGSGATTLPPEVTFSTSGISLVPPEQPGITQASEMTFNSMALLIDESTGQPATGRCFYLQSSADSVAVCTTSIGRTVSYRLSGGVWEAL